MMQSQLRSLGEKMPVGFDYWMDVYVDGVVVDSWPYTNLVPKAGIDYMAGALFGDVAPIGTFYLGLYENNYLPVAGALASDLPSTIGEFVGYSEAARPIWSRVTANGLITNAASRAAFTVTSAKRLHGGFLCSVSEKGGGGGLLLSVARFDSPKDVEPGMVLRVRGELSLVPTNIA